MPTTWLRKISWMRHPVLTDVTLYGALIAVILVAYGINDFVSRFSN